MAKPQRLTDESVFKGTGRRWDKWFKILDGLGAPGLGHKETARQLMDEFALTAWWSQTVAIHYEWERGLRQPGERSRGFGLTIQRTFDTPVERVWRAWTDADDLSVWFAPDFMVDLRVGGAYSHRGSDRGNHLRIDTGRLLTFSWDNPDYSPGSVVAIEFRARNNDRTTVILSHERLDSPTVDDEFKEGWTWALDSVNRYLTTGQGVDLEQWGKMRKSQA